MADLSLARLITLKIAKSAEGSETESVVGDIEPFQNYFDSRGKLVSDELGEMDQGWSRREILTRYLLLQTVLDQGPDTQGVRLWLKSVVNDLYKKDIHFLHHPVEFLKNIDTVIDVLKAKHEEVKEIRAEEWAENQDKDTSDYNLCFGQSGWRMTSIKHILQFASTRWGTPLNMFHLLDKKGSRLVDFIEENDSAEKMSKKIKSDSCFGLGKMIGDKACHLFAKSYVYSFELVRSVTGNSGWSQYSYETPFDSNVGRVLFRSGWLLCWANLDDYEDMGVINEEEGKPDYIRVTDIRENKVEKDVFDSDFLDKYSEIVTHHLQLKTSKWRKVEIQQIPNAILLDTRLTVGQFDDALMKIGTEYCKNNSNPDCDNCPIADICVGHNSNHNLIENYST
ncbi:MAG: hypothetical protein ACOC38_05445 [Promethearchaeia archaeon]